jgi:hypothetical protein
LYAEGLPSRGFLGAASGPHAKKHNPFAYFRSIAADDRGPVGPPAARTVGEGAADLGHLEAQ